ncbi:hypothetical protein [Halochromatium salexigens]|uniref:Uncharacterized protein n=1 Tax=Halochromatium salexigens TaxID=49447 RepID=A0AAJ0UIS0_HALSE|nr:hypothetical protein [Halochromatium salexigens]MBK5932247.1 hypothetical protein [Halochromatium salexigens]
MRSLVLLFLFAMVVAGIALYFKGHANSVNLYHICDKEVSWYDAMFLDSIKDKSGCEKYQ